MKLSTLFSLSLVLMVLFSACSMVEEVPMPNVTTSALTHQTGAQPGPGQGSTTTPPVVGPGGVTQPPAASPRSACEFRGSVTDMRGEYDCEFVISLENGVRIVPVEIERDFFNLEDGQSVILAYRPSNQRISCDRGQPAIITCIEEIR